MKQRLLTHARIAVHDPFAPREMPLVQGEGQTVGGDATQVLVVRLERRNLIERRRRAESHAIKRASLNSRCHRHSRSNTRASRRAESCVVCKRLNVLKTIGTAAQSWTQRAFAYKRASRRPTKANPAMGELMHEESGLR